ncbi:TetR/AcrR family transcriptional regulator [Brachybacterium kimchii]|uniref:TetR/AcrR family transcriptional regulator n=1 Tax=Brachybacterium kimchii TaxID=2942909 RepID=A0ABY4N8F3_9MICO|nr:TetR/AcrR family transcriptional regulator [Brachybacterium kimchii]UQN29678.1 TetR/AcrR family transcriptional regulator [Brachybacterium kimchii]
MDSSEGPAPTGRGEAGRAVEDARVLRSRTAVKDAFEALSREQGLETISISQLCKAAGISRPTFYQHFADIDDVYASVVRDRLEAGERRFLQEAPDEDPLEHILERLRQGEIEASPALDAREALPRARSVVFDWLCERVTRSVIGAEPVDLDPVQRRRIEFAVGGLMAVLGTRYLRADGAMESPEEAAVVREAMGAVLSPLRP